MATSHYDQFLQEATTRDPASDRALGRDPLYGLYTSWCFLSQAAPRSEDAFWAAMKKKQVHPKGTGLRMKGPAAADYILASYPVLV
ncbi:MULTISPECIES: hypothetical protein [Arthrobacter]|jgi:hypothetical protein|uniref:Uncharacterized protein n=1 Tax=Arthrobacter humicola TaxID=409291 RepID=A0ABN2Z3C0_9MICC|nr:MULTISPECIES: hypothetical protein [unclassified Arthrobacter]PVZ57978.1 hypothetical protein C9424_08300 [Arthrobacter sp. H-02-3]SDO97949.1 hypothetical protein SAMN04487914_101427 [Arthrobacter sp. ok909]